VLAGADPLMLPLLRKGGAGCITATSNLMARDLAFIYRHFADAGRAAEVEAAQARVVAERNRTAGPVQIAAIKALTASRTGKDGWRRMRPPMVPLSAEQAAALGAG
jgi:4-hydroxy-tetrahydrodipicolinate synthase